MLVRLLISMFTFPGVVVHEFSHKFFCDLTGVKVVKVCYFKMGNPSGYVVHEQAQKFIQSFLIAIGPFLIGTLFSVALFVLQEKYAKTPKGFVFLWLAVSIAACCFPSSGDAKALWHQTKKQVWHSPIAFLGFPISFAIWIVSFLGFLWFNLLYAFLLFEVVGSYAVHGLR